MVILNKIINRDPDTILGKKMSELSEHLSGLSFIIYFVPIIVYVIVINVHNNTQDMNIPNIINILIVWYFLSMWLISKDTADKNKIGQIMDLILYLPVYYSFGITYIIVRFFLDKDKYPDITPDKLEKFEINRIRRDKLKKLKKIKIKKVSIN